jgi:hypothetical protein
MNLDVMPLRVSVRLNPIAQNQGLFLEQTRVRSQQGVIVRSTLTTIVTLLLEMAGTRHKPKKPEHIPFSKKTAVLEY